MKFDMKSLYSMAADRHVPLADLIDVVEAALTDAYAKTPNATPGATAHLDQGSHELSVAAPDGRDVTPPNFGRLAATTTRQAIVQWLRNMDRIAKVGPWAEREGTIVYGAVGQHRPGRPETRVNLGESGVEGVLPDGETYPADQLTDRGRVALWVLAANSTESGLVRVTVSRRQPALVPALFRGMCAPLRDGQIEVTRVARDPGARTKIAVTSQDPTVDPVNALIGPHGEWARHVTHELGGEKIDVVAHSTDLAAFVAAALTPATGVTAELTDTARRAVTARVAPDQVFPAAGRKGSNISLAQRLTGGRITLETRK